MTSKIHERTVSSFLDAMVQQGDKLRMKSVNAILSSFSDFRSYEQEKVVKSPKVNSRLHARWDSRAETDGV